jgi:hypothetical protein
MHNIITFIDLDFFPDSWPLQTASTQIEDVDYEEVEPQTNQEEYGD